MRISAAAPDAKLIALWISETEEDVLGWAEAGIAGYVPNTASVDALIGLIEEISCGGRTCPSGIAGSPFRRVAASGRTPARTTPSLTRRDLEILRLVTTGLRTRTSRDGSASASAPPSRTCTAGWANSVCSAAPKSWFECAAARWPLSDGGFYKPLGDKDEPPRPCFSPRCLSLLDPTIAAGQPTRLFAQFCGPHRTLLGYGADRTALAPCPGLYIHAIGLRGDLVDDGGHFRDAYGLSPGEWVLVRPDGYVGVVIGADEIPAVERYLADVGVTN
jgi:hypothetical protein